MPPVPPLQLLLLPLMQRSLSPHPVLLLLALCMCGVEVEVFVGVVCEFNFKPSSLGCKNGENGVFKQFSKHAEKYTIPDE